MALTDNLVSYYKLDETSGTTVTDSHGSNDGTNSGATVGETGKINTAYYFDGSDNIIASSGVIGDTTISASVWFKSSSVASTIGRILCINSDGVTSGNGVCISFEDGQTGKLAVLAESIGWGTSSSSSYNDDEWHFAVLTQSGGSLNLYIDGGASPVSTLSVSPVYGNYLTIGANTATSSYWLKGYVDEVGIWNKTLTTTEITELYNSGYGLAYPFLEAPVAEFSATPLTGERDLTIAFTDSSTNTPTSWFWDFGDDNTSTLQNPSNTYYCSGNFTVSLTATNSAGSDEEEKIEYIVVTDPSSTMTVGSGSIGSKYIATNYPVTEGLIAGTTKQTTNPNLVATEEDSF